MDLPEGSVSARQANFSLKQPHLPISVSLLSMSRGQIVREYSCVLNPEARSLPFPSGRLQSPALLKITAGPDAVLPVSIRRPREEVLFFIDRPGRLILAYGGFEQRPTPFPSVQRQPGIREIEIGPVVTHSISLSPELARLAGGFSQAKEVQLRWNLNLPKNATPGQWVAVELTPEMKSSTMGAEYGDWGIVSGGRMMPSFGKADPVPLLGKNQRVALATDPSSPGRSLGEMLWGKEVFPVIWLSFKAHNLSEPVLVRVEAYRDPKEPWRTPGEPPSSSWTPVGQTTIECGPWTSDCMAMMGYVGPTPEKVMITVEGRTLPPPRSIEVSVWRLRHRLVFPVPEGLNVQLISGTATREAGETLRPYISIDRIPDNLPAAIVGALVDQGVKKHPWDRILFIAGLILAVAVLLYLIVKLLPKKEAA